MRDAITLDDTKQRRPPREEWPPSGSPLGYLNNTIRPRCTSEAERTS